MKNYYLLLFLLFGLFGKAQIINFPDANFKAKLLAASPSNYIAQNLTGNYFKIDVNNNSEIEVSEALNVSYLDLSYYSIQSLEGILNFSNLVNLNCMLNELTSLNVNGLINLITLNCSSNNLSSLNLNGLINLTTLQCYGNLLTSLNANGLVNLDVLMCADNNLVSLDVGGLVNLTILRCEMNELSSLNISELINLIELNCSDNNLTTLNVNGLVNLEHFFCHNNQLSYIDVSSLVNLELFLCDYNQLSNIDVSSLVSLLVLSCSNNQLTTLDISNNNIGSYNCANNLLQFLNIKNGVNQSLYFDNDFNGNPNLQYICVDDFESDFIQNKIIEYGYINCHVNSYCSFIPGGQFYSIQGQQKFDNENDNCDVTDNFIPNFKYSITDGTTTGTIISNNSGTYSIPVQAGLHTITPIFENPSYFNVSPPNVVVNFPTQSSPFIQDFCIAPNGIHHDVEVSILPTSPARPGFDAFYKIIYKNKGNQTENGVINLAFDDAVLDLVSTNPAFTSQTINNLTFNYSNLLPFETREIIVVFNVNSQMETPAVNSGDILNYTATNTIANTDEMLSDNTFVLNQTVVNSYDPNDKTCLQGNYVGPDKIGEFVHYMIRFENTGTFPAENIVVKDMIDTAKFDVSSIVPLNASHNYVTKITGNKVEFIFENINLPFDDANNDGYVAFKIKTLPTLVVGNTFSNSANIYFDYNFPIVTNTATTTIAALNNPSFDFATYFSLYPNPTKNELNINLKSAVEINSIHIYNTIGQLVTVQTGNALKVDVSNLKTGNYFIKINTNEGYTVSQFIKE